MNESASSRRRSGHFVLLLPGFSAGDWSNAPLAAVVRRTGARPKRWRLGSNDGPTERVVRGLDARLHELYYRNERKVTVVGMSLGGVFARRLGRRHPELVRQVISIGAPFRFDGKGKSAIVERLWTSREHSFDPEVLAEIVAEEDDKAPMQIPVTSIYSRRDDVVPWQKCLNAVGDRAENIEVRGANHLGLLLHPGVHLALVDRITQPEDRWRPFRAPIAARALFREAVYFDPARARHVG